MKSLNKDLLILSFKRMLWTIAQVVLSMITVGAAIKDIDWINILSIAAVAGLYSFLKSIVLGVPEAERDGTLIVDDSLDDKTAWTLNVEVDPAEIYKKKTLNLTVQKEDK